MVGGVGVPLRESGNSCCPDAVGCLSPATSPLGLDRPRRCPLRFALIRFLEKYCSITLLSEIDNPQAIDEHPCGRGTRLLSYVAPQIEGAALTA